MSDHARFAPSSAEQWGNCSGSVAAQAGRPNLDTPETLEGTAAHWVMAEVLLAFRDPGHKGPLLCSDLIGKRAPNGVVIDDEIADSAQVIVDDVLHVCQKTGLMRELLIEQRVHMPDIHPDNWGTCDVALYVPSGNTLFVWDYKHGHRECEVRDNLQLINYAAGLMRHYGLDDQRTHVVFRIVQPRCYTASGPVREWVTLMSALRAQWNRLHNAAHEADKTPTLSSGLHCRDCRAVGECPAARKSRYHFIDLVNEPYEMDKMQGDDLAVERRILRDGIAVARARLDAIEDELKHRITQGDASTGLALETSQGRLNWTCTPQHAGALATQFGFDISKPAVMTPTQAIKAAPKEVRPLFEQVVGSCTDRKAGALTLVDASETRSAKAFQRRA